MVELDLEFSSRMAPSPHATGWRRVMTPSRRSTRQRKSGRCTRGRGGRARWRRPPSSVGSHRGARGTRSRSAAGSADRAPSPREVVRIGEDPEVQCSWCVEHALSSKLWRFGVTSSRIARRLGSASAENTILSWSAPDDAGLCNRCACIDFWSGGIGADQSPGPGYTWKSNA